MTMKMTKLSARSSIYWFSGLLTMALGACGSQQGSSATDGDRSDTVFGRTVDLDLVFRKQIVDLGEFPGTMSVSDNGRSVGVSSTEYESSFAYDTGELIPSTPGEGLDGYRATITNGDTQGVQLGFVLRLNPLAPWTVKEQPLANCNGVEYFQTIDMDASSRTLVANGVTYSFAECGLNPVLASETGWLSDYIGFSIYPVPLLTGPGISLEGDYAYKVTIGKL